MNESLYRHYEQELLYIRELAQEFGQQYPAAAGRLLLEPNRSVDPHVERLIESFALLTARVQQKLDDDFPELTDAMLNVLYPHYLAPIPSMAIVQFEPQPASMQPTGLKIPRHSRLHTQQAGAGACRFRTCYPVTLWPVEVKQAALQSPPFPDELDPPPQAAGMLRLQLECLGDLTFADLQLEHLRFYLNGASPVVARLYELLFNQTLMVEFRSPDKDADQPPVRLKPSQCLSPVGFANDEGLLPYSEHSFLGYRLLTEFFSFREKFAFVDLGGWRRAASRRFGKRIDVVLYLNRSLTSLEQEIHADTFRLGCAPIVNLFEQTAEPIALTQKKFEYRVVPDIRRPEATEVYSIERVTSADPRATREYQPFYALRHAAARRGAESHAYWYASRRISPRSGDQGSEVYLNLVDLDFEPRMPAEAALLVRTTCTNRDVPVKLQHLGEALEFELEAAVPLKRIRCLRKPTAPLRPPLRRQAHWRLISHLSLNHLSISDPEQARSSLQEILRLYDFSDQAEGLQLSAVNRQLIEGVTGVSSRRVVGRTGGPAGSGFCRGVEVTIEFDEQKLLGVGSYLFASVLERFLGLYASINSFSQLVARTKQGAGVLKKWPPRAGETQLL